MLSLCWNTGRCDMTDYEFFMSMSMMTGKTRHKNKHTTKRTCFFLFHHHHHHQWHIWMMSRKRRKKNGKPDQAQCTIVKNFFPHCLMYFIYIYIENRKKMSKAMRVCIRFFFFYFVLWLQNSLTIMTIRYDR